MLNYLKVAYRLGRWRLYRGGWIRESQRNHDPFQFAATKVDGPIDVMVAIVDHFEPTRRQGESAAGSSVKEWCENYENMVVGHVDSDGVCPQHTWFHRFEFLSQQCLKQLSLATFKRLGEVEFHLHHGFDDHASFSAKVDKGLKLANQYGAMLTAETKPKTRFAYIAGNWSLDNGTGDASKSGCNTELSALREMGCYADFTFPALGSYAQPRKSNSIYYATECPKPKSYNTGTNVKVGGTPEGDLMIVQGPSLVDWKNGVVEDAAIELFALPSAKRLNYWLRSNIHIRGKPDWLFVKLHTHGMQSQSAWFGGMFEEMFTDMDREWNRPPFRLHYVTAREMYNIIKAAETGCDGNPDQFRDFEIARPVNREFYCDAPAFYQTIGTNEIKIELVEPIKQKIMFRNGSIASIAGKLKSLEITCHEGIPDLTVQADGEIHVESNKPYRLHQSTSSPT